MTRFWLLLLVFLTLGTQLESKSSIEIPKERSISLMLPVKFGKRGGNQYAELFNAGAISMNFCKDPTADILRSRHIIVIGKLKNKDNYSLSLGVGASWIQSSNKLGFGFGISYDLAGKQDGTGIGMLEGLSWEDFGILLLFHLFPSQSSFEASNSYVKKARELKNKGILEAALETLLKAWRSNPENDEALKEILKIVHTINKPETYIKVAKQASKLNRTDIAKDLLRKVKEKNWTPKQIKEIEKMQKNIENKDKKLKDKSFKK